MLFLYSVGDIFFSFLKQREKYLGSLNPHLYATSDTLSFLYTLPDYSITFYCNIGCPINLSSLILKFYQTVILLRLLLLHGCPMKISFFLLFFLPGSNKKPCFCWQISFTKHTNLSGKH